MSFGDPNNPYGQQQGRPDYGYPQGKHQPPQPGYGYPQAPPVHPYGAGYPGALMTEMPGGVKAARVMLFVIGGLQVLGAGFAALTAVGISAAKSDPTLRDDIQFQEIADWSAGGLWFVTLLILGWGAFAIVLGAKFGNGGNGIRIAALVFGVITAVLGIYPFVLVGLVHTVLAVLVAVFVGKADGAAWFNRPRY
ncbi:hypothetical protein SSP531S_16140 [Streptomyces spongiicola]|uniref:Integral membrane protein n=1 Tax=Streptomyces spongiicola TaxID=1690221 RepID=A0A2S1Z3T4_9ACTN|nr:hypothetical protein [Streptomyces spongiicola]AWK11027.1 hypothetical protein DDQ41_21305 [Streptomyces spongiicola]GBQ00200.1 hypothetical protein SSP531S_16140 [Streptomyces spongiicola]